MEADGQMLHFPTKLAKSLVVLKKKNTHNLFLSRKLVLRVWNKNVFQAFKPFTFFFKVWGALRNVHGDAGGSRRALVCVCVCFGEHIYVRA